MNIRNTGIVLFSAIALAACGGSASKDLVEDINNIHVGNSAPSIKPISNGTVRGGIIDISEKNNHVKAGSTINTIVIDGKSYKLDQSELKHDWNVVKLGRDLTASQYGYLYKKGEKEFLFYQGIPTESMPAGKASYSGSAMYIGDNDDAPLELSSQFNVDFAAKKLTGVLTGAGKNIELAADITDNTFKGKKGTFTTEGRFYGNAAAELAGAYLNDSKDAGGIFGASKK